MNTALRLQAGRFLLRANRFSDVMHQLGELLVRRFGLGVHEIEDFARFVGHDFSMLLIRSFDKLRMTDAARDRFRRIPGS